MATTRIYTDLDLVTEEIFRLPETAGHHVSRVLRMRIDDSLILFNGKGGEYSANILSVQKSNVEVKVSSFSEIERESPIQIELAQGLSKGEKMDFTIQKAVELGVNKIVPLITSYSNVRQNEKQFEKKLDHWRKVITSACEQCGRNQIPELDDITKLIDWMPNNNSDLKIILDPEVNSSLADLSNDIKSISLVIGPEGGLSSSEIQYLKNNGFMGIRLGPRILRTETAALAAVSALQNRFGDY